MCGIGPRQVGEANVLDNADYFKVRQFPVEMLIQLKVFPNRVFPRPKMASRRLTDDGNIRSCGSFLPGKVPAPKQRIPQRAEISLGCITCQRSIVQHAFQGTGLLDYDWRCPRSHHWTCTKRNVIEFRQSGEAIHQAVAPICSLNRIVTEVC